MKATWNGAVIAESDQTITIEGSHYFPAESVHREYLIDSDTHTTCPWRGPTDYYSLMVDGQENRDAAWYYPQPKDGSIEKVGQDFTNYVAFGQDVEVAK